MNANIWIVIGVLGAAVAAFSLPYGFYLKSRESTLARPHISIETDVIEYSDWTQQEKLDDPEATKSCDKIKLYFKVQNKSDHPAANIDINAISEIIQEQIVGKLTEGTLKTSYTHNVHLIAANTFGRQPFILALDKKATEYFKKGTIKVKLNVTINYTDINNTKSFSFEGAFIYSPVFKNHAEEVYSKEI